LLVYVQNANKNLQIFSNDNSWPFLAIAATAILEAFPQSQRSGSNNN